MIEVFAANGGQLVINCKGSHTFSTIPIRFFLIVVLNKDMKVQNCLSVNIFMQGTTKFSRSAAKIFLF